MKLKLSTNKRLLWLCLLLPFTVNSFGQELNANFIASRTQICVGSTVEFRDISASDNFISVYIWYFGDNASPSTALGVGPHTVTYETAGLNTVSLTIISGLSDTETKLDYITVSEYPSEPVFELTQPTCLVPGGTIEITSPIGSGIEYTIDGDNWGSSNVLNGLAADENYNVFVRDINQNASCISDSEFYIEAIPTIPPPQTGTVSQPTCTVMTGSVVLNNLPTPGTWTIFRNPGSVVTNGAGTSTMITGIPEGSYTFTVTNEESCTSLPSANVTIDKPPLPPLPVQLIDCSLGYGLGIVNVTSPVGPGYSYSLDNGSFQSSTVFEEVENGTHSITVRNSEGCTITGNNFNVDCECVNFPVTSTGSISGSVCGTEPFTVNGNTFGGGANRVNITEDGAGTVSPAFSVTSPFSFTYTPAPGDAGKVITITLTTNDPPGPCESATATFELTINSVPSTPVVQNIIQPNCEVSTGIVSLNDLPASGIWKLTRNPGQITTEGSGSITTVSGLEPGVYSFTVSNAEGCHSSTLESVIIKSPPDSPDAPVIGTITHADCDITTGSVMLSGLPASGTWLLKRFPGAFNTEGAGQNVLISGITPGAYNFTVTNSNGCVSTASENFIISNPEIPSAPLIGEITQPTCDDPFGSILLTGLPPDQKWIITRSPDNISFSGNGDNTKIAKLTVGTYNFIITDETSCTSIESGDAIIIPPENPTVLINDPSPVCFPETVDLTNQSITINSSPDLIYSYWLDIGASQVHETPETSVDGKYYIRGTDNSGCFDIGIVNVTVTEILADAGPDQFLYNTYETKMNAAILRPGETGMWSVLIGNAIISDPSDAETEIHELLPGENLFVWTVENNLCDPGLDSLYIMVQDPESKPPSLITPNADGKNDYLFIPGIESYGRSELIIIDRFGTEVFKASDYNNDWNGVDYNGNPLPDGTYFYLFKSAFGIPKSSFIVIRR